MEKDSHKVNIIIADDDEDDCLFFTDALAELGVPTGVTCFSNGAALMEGLKEISFKSLPDILFLDLNMPLKNGFDCLTEIRSNKTFDILPIVIFSTSSQEEAVNTAYESGATFYLKKPDSFHKLKDALNRIFTRTIHKSSFVVSQHDFLIDV